MKPSTRLKLTPASEKHVLCKVERTSIEIMSSVDMNVGLWDMTSSSHVFVCETTRTKSFTVVDYTYTGLGIKKGWFSNSQYQVPVIWLSRTRYDLT